MVRAVTRGTAAKEIILRTPMPPEWIANFHRETLIRSTQATTALEGSPFSIPDIQRLAIGGELTGPGNFSRMVQNYLLNFDTLGTLISDQRLSPESLLKMHKVLTNGAYEPPEVCGALRLKDIEIVDPVTREVIFHGVRHADIPRLLEDMLAWLDELEEEKVSPMIQAGIAQAQCYRIYPFAVANGLVARAVGLLVLFMRGFDSQRIFEIDSYLNNERTSYFAALKTAGRVPPDLTPWLEYCLENMAQSITEVKDRVINLTRQPSRSVE
jgi:Fic family protein